MQTRINDQYREIESSFATIGDLLEIPVRDNGEKLVTIDPQSGILAGYKGLTEMNDVFGGMILLREGVYERILKAHGELRKFNPDLTFDVRYGYRTDEIQRLYFNNALAAVRGIFVQADEEELRDRAHWYAAFPDVAGHPTGGAVDLTLKNTRLNAELDMGIPVFGDGPSSRKIYFASPEISDVARSNRHILRAAMSTADFHGFAGEFWHFSYGDREWAHHKKAPNAIYAPLDLTSARGLIRHL